MFFSHWLELCFDFGFEIVYIRRYELKDDIMITCLWMRQFNKHVLKASVQEFKSMREGKLLWILAAPNRFLDVDFNNQV